MNMTIKKLFYFATACRQAGNTPSRHGGTGMKAKVELYEAPQRSEAEFWSEVEFGYSASKNKPQKFLKIPCNPVAGRFIGSRPVVASAVGPSFGQSGPQAGLSAAAR